MRVLFDTNIVLDLLLDRQPHVNAVAVLFSEVEKGVCSGFLCATTLTTVHYLTGKAAGMKKAQQAVGTLLTLFEIAPVNRQVLESALVSKFKDYEDAVLHEAALHRGIENIVTRDTRGFKPAKLTIYTPGELCKILLGRKKG